MDSLDTSAKYLSRHTYKLSGEPCRLCRQPDRLSRHTRGRINGDSRHLDSMSKEPNHLDIQTDR